VLKVTPHLIATKIPVIKPKIDKNNAKKYMNLFLLKLATKAYLIFDNLHKMA